jgi:hypothetical protein
MRLHPRSAICFRQEGCHLNDVRSDSMIDRDHPKVKGASSATLDQTRPNLGNIVERITTYQLIRQRTTCTNRPRPLQPDWQHKPCRRDPGRTRRLLGHLNSRSRGNARSSSLVPGLSVSAVISRFLQTEISLTSMCIRCSVLFHRIVHCQSSRSGSKEPSRPRFS